MAVGRKTGLLLTDKKKMRRTEGKRAARTKWKKSPAEKICEAECAVGEREEKQREVMEEGGRKKEDQRERKANSLYVKQKSSEI